MWYVNKENCDKITASSAFETEIDSIELNSILKSSKWRKQSKDY